MGLKRDLLRSELVGLLRGGKAHVDVEKAIRGVPADAINSPVPDAPYTLWELMEHLRLTQWDILDFVRNPDYTWPKWPDDYWPAKEKEASFVDWNQSVESFLEDLAAMVAIVEDGQTDLFAPLGHAPDYTILREVLVIADHNSHHLGQILLLRRQLGVWP